jgi:hypothetical protein
MPVFGKSINVPGGGGGRSTGSAVSGTGAALGRINPRQTAIQQAGRAAATVSTPRPKPTGAKNTVAPSPTPMDTGAGSGYSEGGGGSGTAANPLDSPAYMTYVNELMRQRQNLEAVRDRDTGATDQRYNRDVTRASEEAGRGREQIDTKWSGRNLTRSGVRLNDQQTYQDAVTRQLSDLMLAQQEQRNAIAQAYTDQVNELRRQQAQYALQYGIPIDPNNPTLIPV